MTFLKRPLTWLLLVVGIDLTCEYNYRSWQDAGVPEVSGYQEKQAIMEETTPTSKLFLQALLGTSLLALIVVSLALANGEKWEAETDYVGKGLIALVLIVCVIVGGVIVNGGLNFFDPPQMP